MDVHAYVLVNVDPVQTQKVMERLRGISGAVVREVIGPYDIVVELEAEAVEYITATLREKIRPIPGVTSTVTLQSIETGTSTSTKAWE
jgi:DNA-binding Lrp family transcriptional regulator